MMNINKGNLSPQKMLCKLHIALMLITFWTTAVGLIVSSVAGTISFDPNPTIPSESRYLRRLKKREKKK